MPHPVEQHSSDCWSSTSENVVLIVLIHDGADRDETVEASFVHKLMHQVFVFLHRNTQTNSLTFHARKLSTASETIYNLQRCAGEVH